MAMVAPFWDPPPPAARPTARCECHREDWGRWSGFMRTGESVCRLSRPNFFHGKCRCGTTASTKRTSQLGGADRFAQEILRQWYRRDAPFSGCGLKTARSASSDTAMLRRARSGVGSHRVTGRSDLLNLSRSHSSQFSPLPLVKVDELHSSGTLTNDRRGRRN
jgi:hypothetical protein